MVSVVTGVAGFVGSHLTEKLLQQGYSVVGIDCFHEYYSKDVKIDNLEQVRSTAENSEGSFQFVEGSINKEKYLEKLPEEPRYVFHNAAVAGVRNSIKNPTEYAKQNILGTTRLIDYFDSMGKFIFASSSSVYGMIEEKDLPAVEDDDLEPIAPYPQSKKHGEEVVQLYSELYGFDYSILRYFTVYGPRQRPDEAFTKFIQMILNEEPVTIYGDGEQSRDFTFVEDIVRANLLAAKKGENEIYNVGSGRRITVNEMVDVLDKVMDEEVDRKYINPPEGDARHTHADISKSKNKLGYVPEKEFEEGVEECIEWVKEMREKELL